MCSTEKWREIQLARNHRKMPAYHKRQDSKAKTNYSLLKNADTVTKEKAYVLFPPVVPLTNRRSKISLRFDSHKRRSVVNYERWTRVLCTLHGGPLFTRGNANEDVGANERTNSSICIWTVGKNRFPCASSQQMKRYTHSWINIRAIMW